MTLIYSHSNLETEILITLVLQSFNSKLHISLNKFLKMKLFLTTSVLDVHQSLQCTVIKSGYPDYLKSGFIRTTLETEIRSLKTGKPVLGFLVGRALI